MTKDLWVYHTTNVVVAAIEKGLIKNPHEMWSWVQLSANNMEEAEMDLDKWIAPKFDVNKCTP
jgi:hypothetical protein